MSGIPAGAGALLNKRLGKYEILALLALGGTAEIYLARLGGNSGFEKYVVVKCLHDHLADDPDFVKMFLDEARISATLDHSNIVQTFELGEYENRYYMVMEFLAGLSLAMVVRRATERLPGGMIPVPLVLNVAAQACAGLHYAHERTQGGKPLNLVHRDISPQNLVVSFEGVVKVVDFGIARAEYRETKTKAGTIKGKFAYMSPEQCVANAVDRRTDVFALGVIVHELLTGRRLFKRNSPYETYQAVLECAVEPPSRVNNQLDPGLDSIVMKAIAKDRENRYPTAEAFGDAMLGYLHHRGKGSGGGELGRFFEQHFGQEIEEHGERMRELISGRDFNSVDTGMGWDEEEDKNQTRDLTGKQSDDEDMSLDTGEVIDVRPSDASLEVLVGRLQTEQGLGKEATQTSPGGRDEDDEEEDRGQPTQITMNPSELLDQLNQTVARNSQQKVTPVPAGTSTGTSGPAPLPAPPTGPQRPVAIPNIPKPNIGAKPVPPGGKKPGKFPDLPNLPTVVAPDAEPETAEKPALRSGPLSSIGPAQADPSQAPTAIGGQIVNEAAFKRTEFDMAAQNAPPDMAGPMSNTQYAVRASQMQRAQNSTTPEQAIMDSGPQPLVGNMPQSGPQPLVGNVPQSGPHASPISNSGPSGYPMIPGGQRPFSSDLAPSSSPGAQRSPYAGASFDPSAAASLMSPVGEQYPQTDWERAAGMPTAMPTWKLAALFIAVVGGALAITLVIAKLVA